MWKFLRGRGGECGNLRAGEASCKREFYAAFAQPQGGQRQHKSRNTCSLATTKISRGHRREGGRGWVTVELSGLEKRANFTLHWRQQTYVDVHCRAGKVPCPAGSFARKSGRGERALWRGGDHRQPSMKYALPSAWLGTSSPCCSPSFSRNSLCTCNIAHICLTACSSTRIYTQYIHVYW